MKRKIFIITFIIINLIIPTIVNAVEIENVLTDNNTTQGETPKPPVEDNNNVTETEQPQNPTIPEENTPQEPEQTPENNEQEPEPPQEIEEPQESEVTQEPTIPTNVEKQPTTYYQDEYTYEKSSNNYLNYLKIENIEYEPEFNKETTEYYVIVDLDVEQLEITAIAEDENATVQITGDTELEEGENIITIIVTAEDDSQRKYKLIVTKTDNTELANANLKSLKIKGFEIYPIFSKRIYKYNITINEKVNQLEVLAEAENEKAEIEIKGNNDLKEGNNTIIITVTAEDGETKREYSINTFISSSSVEIKKENKLPAIIAIGIGIIIAFILFIHILKNRK